MICYNCTKSSECPTFRTLYIISDDFCINKCKDFEKTSAYKYRKMVANDDLMKLIYDYFMGTVVVDGYTDYEIKGVIRQQLMDM